MFSDWPWLDRIKQYRKESTLIKKTDEIVKNEAAKKLGLIGLIVEDGVNRGLRRQDIIYLIGCGVIKV